MIIAPERFGLYSARTETLAETLYIVVSPDEMNPWLPHVLVAPIVPPTGWMLPTRIGSHTDKQSGGQIALDQIQVMPKNKLARHLGALDAKTAQKVSATLQTMFAF